MELKICKVHGELSVDRIIKRGIEYGKQRYRCKLCMKQQHKDHYQRNKEKINEKAKLYKRANPEKTALWRIQYAMRYKKELNYNLLTGYKFSEEIKRSRRKVIEILRTILEAEKEMS